MKSQDENKLKKLNQIKRNPEAKEQTWRQIQKESKRIDRKSIWKRRLLHPGLAGPVIAVLLLVFIFPQVDWFSGDPNQTEMMIDDINESDDENVGSDEADAKNEDEMKEEDNGTDNGDETGSETNGDQLRERADNVVIALENENYLSLSSYVHPKKGVRFSPYGYVNQEEDKRFEVEEVAVFAEDSKEYDWGSQDGSGKEIIMTPAEYYEDYIYIRDFSRESEVITENEIEDGYGNIMVNVEEEYPDADFVSYYVSGTEVELDWANLILAFEEHEGDWYLVGLIVDRWTT